MTNAPFEGQNRLILGKCRNVNIGLMMKLYFSLTNARLYASLLCGAFVLAFFWSPAAHAQTFVCPNGPGPGEVQVGTTGGSGGVAVIPICATVEQAEPEDDSPPPPPIQAVWVDNHIAIAWHGDSKDVWATWGHREPSRAENIVMEACNATMGGGCSIARSGYNMSVAIAHHSGDQLRAAWGHDDDEAKTALLARCKELNLKCKIARIYTATAWREPADFGDLERKIADDAGVYQQYDFPKNSRIAPPGQ
jgi:Domain of unknown function (DUF4189)